jgi:hypothetical protein
MILDAAQRSDVEMHVGGFNRIIWWCNKSSDLRVRSEVGLVEGGWDEACSKA